jgi:hypothetical protein
MQKYSPVSDDEPNMREDSEGGRYYWCEDVDATHSELIAHNVEAHARIAELEKALRRISELDYKNAATNGAAYEAVQIASRSLMETKS